MSEQKNESTPEPDFLLWFGLVFLIGLVISVAMPNYVGDGRNGPGWKRSICINNLRQIDAAASVFALERGKTNGEVINFPNDLTPFILLNKDNKIPPCPSGGIYSIKKVGDKPTCSLGTTVTPAHVLP